MHQCLDGQISCPQGTDCPGIIQCRLGTPFPRYFTKMALRDRKTKPQTRFEMLFYTNSLATSSGQHFSWQKLWLCNSILCRSKVDLVHSYPKCRPFNRKSDRKFNIAHLWTSNWKLYKKHGYISNNTSTISTTACSVRGLIKIGSNKLTNMITDIVFPKEC